VRSPTRRHSGYSAADLSTLLLGTSWVPNRGTHWQKSSIYCLQTPRQTSPDKITTRRRFCPGHARGQEGAAPRGQKTGARPASVIGGGRKAGTASPVANPSRSERCPQADTKCANGVFASAKKLMPERFPSPSLLRSVALAKVTLN